MKYGELPKDLGIYDTKCSEMMFYQYFPIKLANDGTHTDYGVKYENRLNIFGELIYDSSKDFMQYFGCDLFDNSYIYLTVKHLHQSPNCTFNRKGYHSDGFLTDDINYIWYDKHPTIFNTTEFNLTLDDKISIVEMEQQAKVENEVTFKENTLLRLNQYNIHKVAPITDNGMRTFVKISFSKDRYDLIGNSHNYLLDYNWEMKERKEHRNIPQTIITK